MNFPNKIIFSSVVILALSCHKQANKAVIAGDEEKIRITEHNTIVKSEYFGEDMSNTQTVSFDIDNDGEVDFSILNTKKKNFYSPNNSNEYRYYSELCTKNLRTEITYIPGSETTYTTYLDPTYSYDSILPEKTIKYITGCEPALFATLSKDHSTLLHLSKGELIDESLDWSQGSFNIISSPYEEVASEIHQDTIFTYFGVYDQYCNSLPKNKICYIPVRKKKKKRFYYGWIEIEIQSDYSILVKRTAMKK